MPNSDEILFSVIIPTYNRADKLAHALSMLTKQTYKNFEVIVSDDGSKDNSEEVVKSFKDKLNISYIYNENFGGPARPRNKAIGLANGSYIAFLDSDDWWYPNKLETVIPYLENYDFVYHDLDKHDFSGKLGGKVKGREFSGARDLIIYGNAIPNSSVVVSRKLVKKLGDISEDLNLIAVEDTDYWIRAAIQTNGFFYIKESLGAYWIEGNISISEKQIDRERHLLSKYQSYLTISELMLAERYLRFREGRIYHKLGIFDKALNSYKESIKLPRTSIKLKSLIGLCFSWFKIRI